MSHQRAIDGEEPLFLFDSFDLSPPSAMYAPSNPLAASMPYLDSVDMSHSPSSPDLVYLHTSSTAAETAHTASDNHLAMNDDVASNHVGMSSMGKGKAVSRPLDIVQRDAGSPSFDRFSLSPTGELSIRRRISSTPSTSMSTLQTLASFQFSPSATPISVLQQGPSSLTYSVFTPGTSYASEIGDCDRAADSDYVGKGKAREVIPSLPPLSFSPTDFVRGETNWPDVVHTPPDDISRSGLPVYANAPPLALVFPTLPSPTSEQQEVELQRKLPTRARSFSSLSTRSATSFAARSMTRIRTNWTKKKSPGTLARKLLLGKRSESLVGATSRELVETPPQTPTPEQLYPQLCFPPDGKIISFSEPASPCVWSAVHMPVTPMDLIPSIPDHALVPVHVPRVNLFDTILPKEVKIDILKALLRLHTADEQRITQSQNWTVLKSLQTKHRWMGKHKGYIELMRLSRVRI